MKKQNADRREQLHAAYMFVVNNWAVSRGDVADYLYREGLLSHPTEQADAGKRSKSLISQDAKVTSSLLNSLARKRLLASERMDNETIWQSYYDIENSDADETRASAERDFNEAFPGKVEQAPTGRKGATGARYTRTQLEDAQGLREEGKSWKDIGQILGIKATGHLAKVVKERNAR